jgi:hypothetical protein
MLINKKSGEISLGGNVYGPGLSLGRFEFMPVGAASKPSVNNPPWKSYRHQFIDNTSGLWTFKNDLLIEVILVILQAEGSNSFLNDENQRKKVHDKFLLDTLGLPSNSYDWGDILSVLDQRSQSAMIIIQYKQATYGNL